MQVLVRDNNVEQALRALKRKLQREGVFRDANTVGLQWDEASKLRAMVQAENRIDAIAPSGCCKPDPGPSGT